MGSTGSCSEVRCQNPKLRPLSPTSRKPKKQAQVRGVPFRAFDSYDCPNVGLICLDVKDEPDDIRAWSRRAVDKPWAKRVSSNSSRFEEEGGMASVWNAGTCQSVFGTK